MQSLSFQINVFFKSDLETIKSKISLRSELEKNISYHKKVKIGAVVLSMKKNTFKINDELGSFYCFGCNAKGDIFTIYIDLYNYSFIDTKELYKDQSKNRFR